ncbi:hypothetical protein DM02DRAFT_646709 [Periconia macrospinosa]|uniref:F-box domain-containing protein n=1 Tax=Periconia macrospinosa TaxID=97972 RepID=A0A2V1D5U4_9PLEO|nr:hypothetical protein DM02DRAFT_646709 [Periconia macrospinosa]
MNDAPPLTPIRPRPQSHATTPTTTVAPTASASHPPFRFFDLPRELRDRIYTYALVSAFPFWWPSATSPPHNVALDLLRVSRRMHHEAAPILYTQNKFLFTHPSDCNMFRIIASSHSEHITTVYLRIREKDMNLWTKYLSSTKEDRSLKFDLPNLKTLWIFLRSGALGGGPGLLGLPGGLAFAAGPVAMAAALAAGAIVPVGGTGPVPIPPLVGAPIPPQVGAGAGAGAGAGGGGGVQQQVQALHNQVNQALAHHQHHQHQHHNQPANPFAPGAAAAAAAVPPPPAPLPNLPPHHHHHQHHQHHHHPQPPLPLTTITPHPNPPANNNNLPWPPPPPPTHTPPPPPPASAQPHHHHPYPLFASFLRWERDLGLDRLSLSLLPETRTASLTDVKIVCIVKLPKLEVERLVETYPDELSVVDRNGDARTRFRRVRGVDVCLEVGGV